MGEFFGLIIKGIFTEPTTSVVAILVAGILFGSYLYIKQFTVTVGLQKMLLEELKKNNTRFDKLQESLMKFDMLFANLQVGFAEINTMVKRNYDTITKVKELVSDENSNLADINLLLERMKGSTICPIDNKPNPETNENIIE
jgi:hypothetical protein